VILSWLHHLGFAVAVGGGVAVLVLLGRVQADPGAAPHLRPAIWRIATLGLVAIGVLWATGLTMWVGRHGGSMALGGAWHLKLSAVVVLTALAGFAWGRMRIGRPLPPPRARVVLIAQLAAAATAIGAAIATFGE